MCHLPIQAKLSSPKLTLAAFDSRFQSSGKLVGQRIIHLVSRQGVNAPPSPVHVVGAFMLVIIILLEVDSEGVKGLKPMERFMKLYVSKVEECGIMA